MKSEIYYEIQQFLGEFFRELDNNGLNITDYYSADGVFEVGGKEFVGHEDIRKFFADRNEQVRAKQGGVRTSRHIYVNLRASIKDRDHADVDFINLTYAGAGPPPVMMNLVAPSLVSDVHMVCQRDPDGRWRLKRFVGVLAFMGSSDPILQKIAQKN